MPRRWDRDGEGSRSRLSRVGYEKQRIRLFSRSDRGGRGHITKDTDSVFGHWIQPASGFPTLAVREPPGKSTRNVWRGTLTRNCRLRG
jgi:hypothetical protein